MTNPLVRGLYSAEQSREMDRIAMIYGDASGLELMDRAGLVVFETIRTTWPKARRLVVVCGLGGNGGDGFVVARLAHQAKYRVVVLQLGDPQNIQGDARLALDEMRASGLVSQPFDPALLGGSELIVDAVLGTGVTRPMSEEWAAAVEAMNRLEQPVVAVDVPSGIDANTGCVHGAAVKASLTIVFVGLKKGLFTASGPGHCGKVVFDELGVTGQVYQRVESNIQLMQKSQVAQSFPLRAIDAHKGDFGHVLLIGGNKGMSGAIRIAAEAAVRSGAGLVSVATRPEHAALITQACPELMCYGMVSSDDVMPLLGRATVVCIGPGLGEDAWAEQLFSYVLQSTKVPLVIDASALNLLAKNPAKRHDWVLTPHPGEAARLLQCTTTDVQRDRYQSATDVQSIYGGVVVLKGHGTLVQSDDRTNVCCAGNPGMATGGMGDLLTGMTGGLLAQQYRPFDAASLAVQIHALAADIEAERSGERGMLATDLLCHIRRLLNPFSRKSPC